MLERFDIMVKRVEPSYVVLANGGEKVNASLPSTTTDISVGSYYLLIDCKT